MKPKAICPACGSWLPKPELCSISHTIVPGEMLCSDCGQRETCDLEWAMAMRTGRAIGRARASANTPNQGVSDESESKTAAAREEDEGTAADDTQTAMGRR